MPSEDEQKLAMLRMDIEATALQMDAAEAEIDDIRRILADFQKHPVDTASQGDGPGWYVYLGWVLLTNLVALGFAEQYPAASFHIYFAIAPVSFIVGYKLAQSRARKSKGHGE